MSRQPVGRFGFEIPGLWIGTTFITEQVHDVPGVVVVEDVHELAEIHVGDTRIASDDQHVFIIDALGRLAEVGRPCDDQWIVAQRVHEHELVVVTARDRLVHHSYRSLA